MSRNHEQVPYYSADGASLGWRTVAAAQQLIAGGHVKASYGRRGHLRAIFLQKPDGGNPVEVQIRTGKRYSDQQHLESGRRCWRLKRLDVKDEDGNVVSMRDAFEQVVRECTR